MSLNKETKETIIKKFGASTKDTGCVEVQVALLTQRINELNQHFAMHKKDHASRRGLLKMVGSRRSLLNYVKKTNIEKYRKLLEELSLRK